MLTTLAHTLMSLSDVDPNALPTPHLPPKGSIGSLCSEFGLILER